MTILARPFLPNVPVSLATGTCHRYGRRNSPFGGPNSLSPGCDTKRHLNADGSLAENRARAVYSHDMRTAQEIVTMHLPVEWHADARVPDVTLNSAYWGSSPIASRSAGGLRCSKNVLRGNR
jgi:hypothetical protein